MAKKKAKARARWRRLMITSLFQLGYAAFLHRDGELSLSWRKLKEGERPTEGEYILFKGKLAKIYCVNQLWKNPNALISIVDNLDKKDFDPLNFASYPLSPRKVKETKSFAEKKEWNLVRDDINVLYGKN